MTPKDIVQSGFECVVTPRLEQIGFAYSRTQFIYKRTVNKFIQQISITLSHLNSIESIRFWSAFAVTAPEYNKWLKTQGRESFRGQLGGCMDWNIPGWRSADNHATSFDFTAPSQRERVLDDWLRRCMASGLPYLESLSSWEGLAADLLRWKWHWDRAADFYLIAGRPDKATESLKQGIEVLQSKDLSYSEQAHHILVAKRQRERQQRDREISEFLARIERIRNGEPSPRPYGSPAAGSPSGQA